MASEAASPAPWRAEGTEGVVLEITVTQEQAACDRRMALPESGGAVGGRLRKGR